MNLSVAVAYPPFTFASACLGVGTEAERIRAKLEAVRRDCDASMSASARTLESRFQELLRKWEDETSYLSSIERMVLHPAYQRIIGMGKSVVPLLLREMELRPTHLHWALNAITDEDPVRREHHGRVDLIAQDWIEWGRAQGYTW